MAKKNGAAARFRLRALRVSRRPPLKLEVLGARIGYSKTQISDVERGLIGAGPELIGKLARIYKLTPGYVRRLCQEARRDALRSA